MWHVAELDDNNYHDQSSHFLLFTVLLLSVAVHVAGLAIKIVGERSLAPILLNLTIETPNKPEPLIEAEPAPQQSEAISEQARPLEKATESAAPTETVEKNVEPAEKAAPLSFDIQQAIKDYVDSMPEVEGRDLDGRVFDPVLAAKIYEARRNSKARPGFGPGSYEEGAENGVQDPGSYVYSGGMSQRWVRVGDKCFLVHDDIGLGALRGSFNTWMRTSCKKFNSKMFDDR